MKPFIKFVQVIALALLVSHAVAEPTNTTFNYENNGSDWGHSYGQCMSEYTVQSPVNFKFDWTDDTKVKYYLHDWAKYNFAFLPQFLPAYPKTFGFDNWVYQMSDFGVMPDFFTSLEPLAITSTEQRYVSWQLENIRFHHPAEHKINDT